MDSRLISLKPQHPVRVLHVLGKLGRGGAETWLMNIMRQKPEDMHFDFFLDYPGGAYEEEAKSLGCTLFYSRRTLSWKNRLGYITGATDPSLSHLLLENRYDVIHCQSAELSGGYMKLAFDNDIPIRIAHCHNTMLARGKRSVEMPLRNFLFKTVARQKTLKYATSVLACSTEAGRFVAGVVWEESPKCKLLFCGVPLDYFAKISKVDESERWHNRYAIDHDAIVIGHAGSMGKQKNHRFLIDIFAELAGRNPRYHLFLAGDGPLRSEIEQAIHKRGLTRRVTMPGLCDHVPELMIHLFDLHLLPSLFEGLPIVGMEAAAAGLHTVCSDTITKDFSRHLSGAVTAVPLASSATIWANECEKAIGRRLSPERGIAMVEASPFSISSSIEGLRAIYRPTSAANPTLQTKTAN